ncbi:hypothetical protein [Parabacteroides bouchesdurhonensis]|uniref:hypothetical protein n=1 Tax=Parabacteroides bouchesdurhonensis TaxID=1936995 RepID=UPI000E50116E|nr:hypothetical protein [Parabacteroides bouchesdurhonensis]RHJ93395.1 hypothetical protein DW095_04520 [Bacteroides sp. AM07-16]
MTKRILISFLVFLAFSCSKIEESNIPYANVYFRLDLRYQDKDLIALLAHKEYTTPRNAGEAMGFSGVVVIHGYDEAYYAYDLCCPYEAEQSTKIVPTNAGTAKCPKCGTVYDLSYGAGNPMEGPSKFALRRYTVYPNGQELIVRN